MNTELKNQRCDSGQTVEITAAAAITAGDPQLLDDKRVGIPAVDVALGDDAALDVYGHYYGRKEYNTAISNGDVVGWDSDGDSQAGHTAAGEAVTTGCVTNDPTAWDYILGTAVEDAAATDEDVIYDLNVLRKGFMPGATTVAADVLAIPITHGVVTKTTGADAEALTLADGYVGQKLKIILGTDGGGDATLTPTSVCGFTNFVFRNAGDQVVLEFTVAGWIILDATNSSNIFQLGFLPGSTTVAADALAIPITHGVVNKTTGADAEALTLADGAFVGQKIKITLVTDGGGDGTLTPTTALGFTSIVFRDAGDQVVLEWTASGWIILDATNSSNIFHLGFLPGSTTVAADELAIPITHGVVIKTTGADAEALTLANGAFVGQKLKIVLGTDGGGDGTLTPTTPLGFATIVFEDAGDQVVLEWTASGWIIIGNVGVAAPAAITV